MTAVLIFLLLISLPFQLGKHFWPSFSFIFGLKIDYLSPTLYLQDIFIFFLIIFGRKEIVLFLKSHLKLVIGYWLLVIVNIVFTLTPLLAFFGWVRISELILLGLVIAQNKEKIYHRLTAILPVLVLFEFVLSTVQLWKQASLGGVFWLLGERSFSLFTPGIARGDWLGKVFLRPYGTFSHPNSLAGFTLIACIFIFAKKQLKLFDKLAIAGGFLLIVLCFSRTVWLAGLCLGIFFVLNQNIFGLVKFNKTKQSLNFIYCFSLVAIAILVFLFTKTFLESSSLENRLILAQHSLLIIKNNPLFGVGVNNFIVSLAKSSIQWQWYYWIQPVHNIFLLVASETGLAGFLIFTAFLTLTARQLFRCFIAALLKKRDNDIARYPDFAKASPGKQDNNLIEICLPLTVALAVILFTGLFDHYWLTLIQNQLLFVVVLGLSWGEKNDKILL